MRNVPEELIIETVYAGRCVIEPEYLNTEAAAVFLDVSAITLEKWRTLRIGPPYTSLPRCTRYAVKDLRAFMAKHRIEAEDKPFKSDERRGRPRKDGTRANAATGIARHIADAKRGFLAVWRTTLG